jgi:hypothetical protein
MASTKQRHLSGKKSTPEKVVAKALGLLEKILILEV